ncbi:MAG: translation initiation factor IF-2 [bacterium]|nr:translation initiation factor IF-2 [bacterium]
MDKNNQKVNNALRPPVVVVMGHIDHGKSQLLDYIRKSGVVEAEAGGITQHIGAYEAEVKCDSGEHSHKTQKITFLDTPGHEAFSKMRARGAKIADIAILVIAADEGVKPQTMEAYEAIKQAGIPFIIALNKMDKPEANPEQVKAQLAEKQIFVENYGGDIPVANISAKTGQGVDELLDMVLLLAEMEELKANPSENASGTVIESRLDTKRGISATLLIQNGTMKKGMFVVSGKAIAPVRIFEDFQGNPIEEATFSSPVKIVGFNEAPEVGASFKTFNSKKEAEEEASKVLPSVSQGKTLEAAAEPAEVKITVPVVIKADTAGSIEAVEKEIMKLADEEAGIAVLRKGVGDISEEDMKLSYGAEEPIALGFNVGIDAQAKDLAEKFGVKVKTADIIYKISEWLEEEIKRRKSLIPREEVLGKAEILKIFNKTKNKQVVGGAVAEGKIVSGKNIKIKRKDFEIGEGKIVGLQHGKKETKEVEQGKEFGAMVESKIEIAKGDTIEIIEKIG